MEASTKLTDGPIDYDAVTRTQQATWSEGDFHEVARQNVVMAEALCTALDPHAGQRVLDVACGSGTVALVAARRYCEVAGIDYVPALVDRARQRAQIEGYAVDFRVGDAQELPFPDATFDAVVSVYGVQFAPDQAQAARELLRVCRPGGAIGLTSPMPQGWSGELFAMHARYAPPPAGLQSPLRWGTEDGLAELLNEGVRSTESRPCRAFQYYRSVSHAVEVFSTYFGPTLRALALLDEDTQEQFRRDLESVFERHNRATDGTAVIENTYLQTIVTREH